MSEEKMHDEKSITEPMVHDEHKKDHENDSLHKQTTSEKKNHEKHSPKQKNESEKKTEHAWAEKAANWVKETVDTSNESEEIDIDKRRKELIAKVKENPALLGYGLFSIIFIIGLILYLAKAITPIGFWLIIAIPSLFALMCTYYRKWTLAGLFYIVGYTTYLRTLNLGLLKDGMTGKYIPIALDPHLFLRYAKYILYHGSLMTWDKMRYFPYGYGVGEEKVVVSYVTVYIYKIVHFFYNDFTIELAHNLNPPILYAIGLIIFFFLIKRLFNDKVALLASAILSVMPPYLYRTMAGFGDKEAVGIALWFLAMYLYINAWQSTKLRNSILLGLGSGFTTGILGLTWGGVRFTFFIIATFAFIEIMLNKFEKKDFFIYSSWFFMIILTLPILNPATMSFKTITSSITSGVMVITFLLGLVDFLLFKMNLFGVKQKIKGIVPYALVSIVVTVLLVIVSSTLFFGPLFLIDKANNTVADMLSPFGQDRWQLTVAENHQPYLVDWIGQTSWFFLYMFMLGSVIFFFEMLRPYKEQFERLGSKIANLYTITAVYALFIFFFAFSRYKNNALFDGVNAISKFAYIGSLVIFSVFLIFIYIYIFYKDNTLFKSIASTDRKYVFVFIWFLLMIVAARGAARLNFVFSPITAAFAAYFLMTIYEISTRFKDKMYKVIAIIIIIFITLSPFAVFGYTGILYQFNKQVSDQAKYTGPSYNVQWQMAGKWIQDNTPTDAVFAHWWDYGYWVQTGGNRATVTDGGNSHGYWNYQMGRHVLTGANQTEALEVLYAHNATNLLIISDEIGKYTAYSSIGSDENYDRYSWIQNFNLDPSQTQETRDQVVYVYRGMYVLDDDFRWEGELFPARQSGVVAVLLPTKQEENTSNSQISQPEVVMVNPQGVQKRLPLECLFIDNNMVYYEKPGYKGCFRVMPTISQSQSNPVGSGLFVSEEGVKALWTNLFIFNQKNPRYDTSAFRSVYDDSGQMPLATYQGRVIGPLRIWEIDYPKNFTMSQELIDLYQGFKHENPKALII